MRVNSLCYCKKTSKCSAESSRGLISVSRTSTLSFNRLLLTAHERGGDSVSICGLRRRNGLEGLKAQARWDIGPHVPMPSAFRL